MENTHFATAPRHHARSDVLLCTRAARGELRALMGTKHAPAWRPAERGLPLGPRRPPRAALFPTFDCEIAAFRGEQTQTTWFRAHHAATLLYLPSNYPPGVAPSCCDLPEKATGYAGGCRPNGKVSCGVFFLPHTPLGGLPNWLGAV